MSTPVTNIGQYKAIRVTGHVVHKSVNGNSTLIDFEGTKQWVRNDLFREDKRNLTIDIPEWLYKKLLNGDARF